MPTNTVDGDIMIATVVDDLQQNVTAPGGWTLIVRAGSGWPIPTLSTFYRIASSDSGPYAFTGTDANIRSVGATVSTFQKTSGTWDVEDNAVSEEADASTITTSSVTATNNSMLICTFGSDGNTTVSSAPASMTLSKTQTCASVANNTYYESRSSGAVTKSLTYSFSEELVSVAIVLDLVP